VVRPFETSSVNISGSCEAHLRSALRFGDRSYVRVAALQSRFERLTKLKPPALPGDTYVRSVSLSSATHAPERRAKALSAREFVWPLIPSWASQMGDRRGDGTVQFLGW
jgi:hypothetical protein